MKRKFLSTLLALSIALSSTSMFSVVKASSDEPQIYFLDTEAGYNTFISAAGYAVENMNVSFDAAKKAMKLEFGDTYSLNGKPKFTIPVNDDYKYVNILLGTHNEFGRSNPDDEWYVSAIGYEGETTVCPYTIGPWAWDIVANGESYVLENDYDVTVRNKYLSVTAELNFDNVADGANIIEYFPVYIEGTGNCEDTQKWLYIKAISFFNAESTEEINSFQASIKNVKCIIGSDETAALSVDYMTRSAEINLPKGIETESVSSTDIVTELVSDAYTVDGEPIKDTILSNDDMAVYKVTVKKKDSNDSYTAQDVDTQVWTITLFHTPASENDFNNAVDALNQLTAGGETAYKASYEWLLNTKSEKYKLFTDGEKATFYVDVALNNALAAEDKFVFTMDNISDYVDKYVVYLNKREYTDAASEKESDNLAAFKARLQLENVTDDAYSIFVSDELSDERKTELNNILLSAGNETNSTDFFNAIEVAVIGLFVDDVNRQESEGGIKNIIENNLGLFGLTQGSYDTLCAGTNRIYSAYQLLVGQTFASPEAVISALTNAIATVGIVLEPTPQPVTNVRPSGGGGGGTVSKPKPTETPKPIETPESAKTPEPSGEQCDTKIEFDDIDSVPWATDSIGKLVELGVVSGKGDGKFAPMDNVLREEYITMIVLAFDIEGTDGTIKFVDVMEDGWYAKFIAAAVDSGLISGISDTTFGIGNGITRQDLAVIAYRVAMLMNPNNEKKDGNAFADESEIAAYAKEAVSFLSGHGIISGSYGNFNPKSKATRAEVAVIIDRLLTFLNGLEDRDGISEQVVNTDEQPDDTENAEQTSTDDENTNTVENIEADTRDEELSGKADDGETAEDSQSDALLEEENQDEK